jgi:hypothetical protein
MTWAWGTYLINHDPSAHKKGRSALQGVREHSIPLLTRLSMEDGRVLDWPAQILYGDSCATAGSKPKPIHDAAQHVRGLVTSQKVHRSM